ncbi:tripartite tricarboxylate transporter substrate binding protein [Roseomonas sp. KE2513]|uniref:Bug family tripartite tricarboxylate transporter substrate binding protein n=1 Tax=Roseomonas sp. KE2513 TaxID=2479202 RepID=UPI0018DFB4BA|nr:tripartite tricarboxylate transporter substrate binding protein [Roseomonas sp. KE2513]MBI0538595.1 tripartite tricarboxylate transporter substrate binding protein [Roseomonas sp. KE2513]
MTSLTTPIGAVLPRRAVLAAGLALGMPGILRAQGVAGARPITIIVPYTPGAPPDIIARAVGDGMSRRLGRPVVVENRPGASGNIGTEAVARAAPDGNTLLVQATTLAMNVSLFRRLPYDPVGSFAPIATLMETEGTLALNATTGGTGLAELLSRAKARPGALNYASPGVGTPHHLAMELFKRRAGVDLTHVPYRGLAGAITDILAGHVATMFIHTPQAVELARDERVRVVAVTSETRLPYLPSIPTLAEQGVAGVVMRDWYGLFAPAGTPPETLAQLNEAANAVLKNPDALRSLVSQGYEIVGGSPDGLRERVAVAIPRWAAVVKDAGITAE